MPVRRSIQAPKKASKNSVKKPEESTKVWHFPANLRLRIQNTLKLRAEHEVQLKAVQNVVDDNTRAINNLVLGWLSGKDDFEFDKYSIAITDDGSAVVLIPVAEKDVEELIDTTKKEQTGEATVPEKSTDEDVAG